MCVAHSTRLISRILTCHTRFMVKKIDAYQGVCPLVLVHIHVNIMTKVVALSCRTVYDTTIMIINSANLNRALTSYFSCCESALR